jgi:2-phospho-L-lactate/phosphoenolpyruvate guanylyltransferase
MGTGRVAVIQDRHGTGTNGLLLCPADAIGPAFGPGSADRHRERAERAGFEVVTEPLSSMALDLDTPDDLEALAAELAERPERAPRTAEALAGLGRATGAQR